MALDSGGVAHAAPPDLVYRFRDSCGSDELRYSLRSVCKNADGLFGRVWIAGDFPPWATGVGHIEAEDIAGWRDARAKVLAAVEHPQMASTLVVMDDDFFLMRPITEWRVWHQGPTSAYLAKMKALRVDEGWYRRVKVTATYMLKQGHGDVLARQGHRPLLWDRDRLAAALRAYPDQALELAGLYDIAGAGGVGELGWNTKVTTELRFRERLATIDQLPWLSTSDESFRAQRVGHLIREVFYEPSRFEA